MQKHEGFMTAVPGKMKAKSTKDIKWRALHNCQHERSDIVSTSPGDRFGQNVWGKRHCRCCIVFRGLIRFTVSCCRDMLPPAWLGTSLYMSISFFNQCLCFRSRANCDARFCPYCTATNTEQRKFGIQASDNDTKKCNAEKSQREERNIEKKETKNQKKEDTGNAKRFQNTVFFQWFVGRGVEN